MKKSIMFALAVAGGIVTLGSACFATGRYLGEHNHDSEKVRLERELGKQDARAIAQDRAMESQTQALQTIREHSAELASYLRERDSRIELANGQLARKNAEFIAVQERLRKLEGAEADNRHLVILSEGLQKSNVQLRRTVDSLTAQGPVFEHIHALRAERMAVVQRVIQLHDDVREAYGVVLGRADIILDGNESGGKSGGDRRASLPVIASRDPEDCLARLDAELSFWERELERVDRLIASMYWSIGVDYDPSAPEGEGAGDGG